MERKLETDCGIVHYITTIILGTYSVRIPPSQQNGKDHFAFQVDHVHVHV